MKKRILSLLLVLIMVLEMFPMSAMAAESDVTVTYNGGKTATVTKLDYTISIGGGNFYVSNVKNVYLVEIDEALQAESSVVITTDKVTAIAGLATGTARTRSFSDGQLSIKTEWFVSDYVVNDKYTLDGFTMQEGYSYYYANSCKSTFPDKEVGIIFQVKNTEDGGDEPQLSTDASVSSVVVSGVTATAGENNAYSVELPAGTDLGTLTAADFTVTAAQGATVSGFATADGGKTWTFTVTAEDGQTTQNYTVAVSAAANINLIVTYNADKTAKVTTLNADIGVSGGFYIPKLTKVYLVEIDEELQADSSVVIATDEVTTIAGLATGSVKTRSLSDGQISIKTEWFIPDYVVNEKYTLTGFTMQQGYTYYYINGAQGRQLKPDVGIIFQVKNVSEEPGGGDEPQLSTDASVSSVVVSGVTATAGENNAYSVTLPAGTDLSTLTAADFTVTAAQGATVSGFATADGGKTWTFTVTAEDGTTKQNYTVNVSVEVVSQPEIIPTIKYNNNKTATGTKLDISLTAVKDWYTVTPETVYLVTLTEEVNRSNVEIDLGDTGDTTYYLGGFSKYYWGEVPMELSGEWFKNSFTVDGVTFTGYEMKEGCTYYFATTTTGYNKTKDSFDNKIGIIICVDPVQISNDASVSGVTVDGVAATAGENNAYSVELPAGTDLSTLTAADFTITAAQGATVSGLAAVNGGSTWTFTVTAEDGRSTRNYIVAISVAGDSQPQSNVTVIYNGGKTAVSTKLDSTVTVSNSRDTITPETLYYVEIGESLQKNTTVQLIPSADLLNSGSIESLSGIARSMSAPFGAQITDEWFESAFTLEMKGVTVTGFEKDSRYNYYFMASGAYDGGVFCFDNKVGVIIRVDPRGNRPAISVTSATYGDGKNATVTKLEGPVTATNGTTTVTPEYSYLIELNEALQPGEMLTINTSEQVGWKALNGGNSPFSYEALGETWGAGCVSNIEFTGFERQEGCSYFYATSYDNSKEWYDDRIGVIICIKDGVTYLEDPLTVTGVTYGDGKNATVTKLDNPITISGIRSYIKPANAYLVDVSEELQADTEIVIKTDGPANLMSFERNVVITGSDANEFTTTAGAIKINAGNPTFTGIEVMRGDGYLYYFVSSGYTEYGKAHDNRLAVIIRCVDPSAQEPEEDLTKPVTYVAVSIEALTTDLGVIVQPTLVPIRGETTAFTAIKKALAANYPDVAKHKLMKGSDRYISAVYLPGYESEKHGINYFGEFDKGEQSGWMYSVDGFRPNVGVDQKMVSGGEIIRLQYSVAGYGADLDPSADMDPAVRTNRNKLFMTVAQLRYAYSDEQLMGTATDNPLTAEQIEAYNTAYVLLKGAWPDAEATAAANAALEELFGDDLATVDPEVQAVIDLIKAIGSVTRQSEAAIVAAETAYAALDEAKQAQVTNYATLTQARADFDALNSTAADPAAALSGVLNYLKTNVATPGYASIGGEWAVLAMARGGVMTDEIKAAYLANLNNAIAENELKKFTDYERVTLALTALGIDASKYGATTTDLTAKYKTYTPTDDRGFGDMTVNADIFALIALNSKPYTGEQDKYVNAICGMALNGGGWSLSGDVADVDTTAMAIQALAPYYSTNSTVKSKVDAALIWLKDQQDQTTGAFKNWDGDVSTCSTAQVVTALCALGIDPAGEEWTVSEGVSLLDSLLTFYVGTRGSFGETDASENLMATEQAAYALVAWNRMSTGKTALYDMSDVYGGNTPGGNPELEFGLSQDEILGYVTVSFVDNGVRKSEELNAIDAEFRNPLGTIIPATRVPFKANDTIAAVTLRLLDEKGFTYENDGNAFYGFYLESIGNFNAKGNYYESFGEFDAGRDSGWMITQNDVFINKGASEFYVKEGDLIEWQYTCQLGADIGDTFEDEAVSAVKALIDAIGTVTLESEEAITEAREAYDELSDLQKRMVTNYKTLTDAEKKLAELKATAADEEAAQKVEKLIDAIGTVTLDSEEAIEKARKAYDALSDLQKDLVSNYETLTDAEELLAAMKAPNADYEKIYKDTGDYLETLCENYTPVVNSIGGEWMVFGLARSDREVPAGYYDEVVKYVNDNINDLEQLDARKSTENSRVILALTAAGYDVTDVAGHNLLEGLTNLNYLKKQGINGPVWALIAFDSYDYEIPTAPVGANQVTREKLIDTILAAQLDDGGWNVAASIKTADSDMTAMAITALAPYYDSNAKVKAAVDTALKTLSDLQMSDGSFGSTDGSSAESCAQVLVALTAMGINPERDAWFIKNGNSVVDALCAFAVEDGGFKHIPSDTKADGMATEQGYYALNAYIRFLNDENALFDLTDDEVVVCEHKNTEVQNAKNATCTETGYTGDTYCKDCELLIKVGTETEAKGHSYGQWTVVEKAKIRKEGKEERVCACGEKEFRAIEKLQFPFTDVKETSYAYDTVAWAVDEDITIGMTETTFVPNGEVTRGQVVTFLWRAAGAPKAENVENPFTDVEEGKFYYDAVLWAVENGITIGRTETTFAPKDTCTRGEVVTFLWRFAEKPDVSSAENPFDDLEEGRFYVDAVLWAVEEGITIGIDKVTFGPGQTCKRAQIVTFIYRYMNK